VDTRGKDVPVTARYPFSAVVGMDDLKLALLLNAVSPGIGGVLVRGEKGTAKSTVVRALAALLPPVQAVAGCRFHCDPATPDPACPDGPHEPGAPHQTRRARLVELPVGASEDRVVGALDLERALTEGIKAFEPGLLAAAHRGLLYVDEVNLLHDHLVDLLLDAAAMGRSHVEREGVSVSHAAQFLLVGTMNPEEGELRPQLLDRFGLAVQVAGTREPSARAEVVRRRLAFEADPAGFARTWSAADGELADRISCAQRLLPAVTLPDEQLARIAQVCTAFEVDGLRADLVTARTAVANAAWHDRDAVTAEDVRQAARLALPHRGRRNPFDAPGLDERLLDEALHADGPEPPDPSGGGAPAPEGAADEPSGRGQAGSGRTTVDPPGRPYRPALLAVPGLGVGAAGRRSRAETEDGRTTGARPQHTPRLARLHVTATLRAAAPHQHERGRQGPGLVLRRDDLREAVREGRESNLVLFCVDASGSMAARQRMSAVKGALLSLLLDAYQRRDKVGLVTFRGVDAEVALPPTSSIEAGAARLRRLPTGGRTPLAAGLLRSREVLRIERLRDPRRRPLLVVVTDGKATSGANPLADALRAAGLLAADGIASVVVDCESGPVRLGLAATVADALRGVAIRLEEMAADGLATVVRDARRPVPGVA
jgi:magnesium chelatase subunit D